MKLSKFSEEKKDAKSAIQVFDVEKSKRSICNESIIS